MGAKNALGPLSGITLPSYRGKYIQRKMVEEVEKTANKGDIVVLEVMKEYKSTSFEILKKYNVFREIRSTGGFVHTVAVKQAL